MFPLYVSSDKSDIFGLFRYVYVTVRLWGYFSFSANLNEVPLKREVRVTLINILLLLIHLSLHVVWVVIMTLAYLKDSSTMTILMHGSSTAMLFGIVCGLVFIVADFINRNKIWRIFLKFMQFDSELTGSGYGFSIDYKSEKKIVNYYVTIWVGVGALFSTYTIFLDLKSGGIPQVIIDFVFFYLIFGTYMSDSSVFSFILHNVKFRFKLLNQNLRTLSEQVNRKSPFNTPNFVMRMAELHGQLNDIIDDANNCFSIQVMLCFAGIFAHLVISIFCLFVIWLSAENDFTNTDILGASVIILWSFFYLYFGLVVIYLGSSTSSEGRYTGVILHECINRTHDNIIVERLLTFSQQLLHRTPDARCKLFSFDWTLLLSIIAAGMTYLTILTQFNAANNNAQSSAVNYCPTQPGNTTSIYGANNST